MRFLLVLLIIIPSVVFSQVLPEKNGKVEFEKVDSAAGSKDQLYAKAKKWVINIFTDAKSVIQLDDKEQGEIIGKGNFDFLFKFALTTIPNTCRFSFQIDCKENKYRIRIYDLVVETGTAHVAAPIEYYVEKPNKNPNNKVIAEVKAHVNDILQNLHLTMTNDKKDDF